MKVYELKMNCLIHQAKKKRQKSICALTALKMKRTIVSAKTILKEIAPPSTTQLKQN